jgi:hypothetical protein
VLVRRWQIGVAIDQEHRYTAVAQAVQPSLSAYGVGEYEPAGEQPVQIGLLHDERCRAQAEVA